MIIRHKEFSNGYNPITSMDDKNNKTQMDYGVLILKKNQEYLDSDAKEKAYLLVKGKVIFQWGESRIEASRDSCFDENPCCIHVPSNVEVKVTSLSDEAEISVTKTNNEKSFTPKFYSKEECRSEDRGAGSMKETSTRIVRTIIDYSNAPYANLVVGEVINYPGKWSSYPPHHHPQPEIYYYKLYPEQGFGFSMLGEEVLKVRDSDTVIIIDDASHPQVTAPGYAMYYVWVIRHLDGDPYITPVFEPEHLWVTDKNARNMAG